MPKQSPNNQATLTNPLAFILAGKAIFTLQNTNTQNRFTFQVTKKSVDQKSLHFVSVLTQGENTSPSSYHYLGTIFDGAHYRHGKKSQIDPKASSSLAFGWLMQHLSEKPSLPSHIKICHCGHCGRCGKLLTVPESIESGLGPICRGEDNEPTNQKAKRGKAFA
jgi:hypothetical protein